MKLNTLRLRNFRCFEDTRIEFNECLTVFVANNGAGKTSILDAAAIAFGPYLTRLPGVKGKGFSKNNDLKLKSDGKKEPFMAIASRIYDDAYNPTGSTPLKGVDWSRVEKRDQSKKTAEEIKKQIEANMQLNVADIEATRLKDLNAYADHFIDALNTDTSIALPILAYYGTGRGVFDIPERRRGFGKNFERLDAYTQCLDPKTNFRKFFEFFYFLEDAERREKEEHQSFAHRKPELEVIRLAISRFLKDFSNPHTKTAPLRFLLERGEGTEKEAFNIEMLSDGFRTSIAMVMDIASRMAEANPHMGIEALSSHGVVMIDEIEMHLHPRWQQTIIPDLQRTFPNIQFICTTHSPQVLTTVDKSSIRLILDDKTVRVPSSQTMGTSSHDILSMVMGADAMPDLEITRKLSKLVAEIEKDTPPEDLATLWNELETHYGKESAEMLNCDRLIRLQQFKQKLASAKTPNQED